MLTVFPNTIAPPTRSPFRCRSSPPGEEGCCDREPRARGAAKSLSPRPPGHDSTDQHVARGQRAHRLLRDRAIRGGVSPSPRRWRRTSRDSAITRVGARSPRCSPWRGHRWIGRAVSCASSPGRPRIERAGRFQSPELSVPSWTVDRRYAIVSEGDLREAGAKLAASRPTTEGRRGVIK